MIKLVVGKVCRPEPPKFQCEYPTMNDLNKAILPRLLSKGDKVAVVKGCLVIVPASDKPVPKKWLDDNRKLLLIEIVNLLNIDAFRYLDYSTGRYKAIVKGKEILCPGITLQFECIENDSEAHAIFNAEITRKRNSKHGKAGENLPVGQFRVNNRHNFYKFWESTGIQSPSRNSAFHDYMGKLKSLLFVGELGYKSKFINKTLRPLELSSDLIKDAYIQSLPDNIQATTKQLPDNYQTKMPNKEMTTKPASNDVAMNLTTGGSKYGLSYQGSAVISIPLSVNTVNKSPEEQTTDEWIKDYDNS